ncbi:hypothetical protein [Brevundimonas sp. 374]|uniref:hypothetical protein n=1 Tax=Brevundimonas sp. 374 TaxID=1150400 RepID=UPI00088802C8|nr:hypothetical protein [Brevundimonas sp. 374]SDQ27759.1 hypothetical protein SAMN02787020_0768 [Brevundimonas sp. 374]
MDPKPPSARLALSVSEFCDTCSISRSLFYQEVKAGRILTLKAGKRTLIAATEAHRWLNSLSAA